MTVPTATAATAATGAPATSAQEQTQAHPMLPPRNASPEWYAQAMDQALAQEPVQEPAQAPLYRCAVKRLSKFPPVRCFGRFDWPPEFPISAA